MSDRSVEARLLALRERRPATAIAHPAALVDPPSGQPVAMPPPLLRDTHAEDPVALAGARRIGRRTYPARRARIGVTAAAAAGFVALVPLMGPLTSAAADDNAEPADADPGADDATSGPAAPDTVVDATVELTTTTTTIAPTGTSVQQAIAPGEAAPVAPDPTAALPALGIAPAPVAPRIAPAAPVTPSATPVAPTPATTPAPAPPVAAPVAPVATPAPPTAAPPAITAAPPPITAAPPPPVVAPPPAAAPPPTTAPPPPTTAAPPPTTVAPPPTTSPS